MRQVFRLILIATALVPWCFCTGAQAGSVTVETPAGTSWLGQAVDARATFTTTTNQLVIQLQNLQANPVSVAQCLSGLQFTVDGSVTGATLASSSATERTINADKSYTDLGAASSGWQLSVIGSSLNLALVDTQAHLIIGPPGSSLNSPQARLDGPPNSPVGSPLYSSAGASITGRSQSPFLGELATFTLNVPGLSDSSTISDVSFHFDATQDPQAVPTPASGAAAAGLLGASALFGLIRRYFKRD